MESIDEAPENTLPLNEESLLRPISGLEKVLNTVDQSKDRPSSNGANAISRLALDTLLSAKHKRTDS